MPPPDPAVIAGNIGTALQAGVGIAQLADDLYDALGMFADEIYYDLGGGVMLVIRPGYTAIKIRDLRDFVFLAVPGPT